MSGESEVRRYQGELQRLRKKLAAETTTVAKKRKQAGDARQAASRSKSSSTVTSKSKEAERREKEANDAETRRGRIETDISRKEGQLIQAQTKRDKERQTAQERSVKKMEDRIRRDQEQFDPGSATFPMASEPFVPAASEPFALGTEAATDAKEFDLFLSHASEDKEEVVRALADALIGLGMKVWYDDFELEVGDSLREKIDEGLARSTFGVVILSPSFFAKEWPRKELDGLVARETASGVKVILPIWHRVTMDDVLRFSPMLGGKKALNTGVSKIADIADSLAGVVQGS